MGILGSRDQKAATWEKIIEIKNNFLPKEFMIYNRRNISIQNGINRINNMNKRYLEIKNKPFEFVDKYYQLHGSHRNRPK